MDTFKPLSPEQYQSARSAGFSHDQIIQNEQKRKSEMVKTVTPDTQNTTDTSTKSKGVLGTIGSGIKKVGNFLFPIVGDVYHDIKGDNQKSFLQQAGDAAMSALPFIPGLGEAGAAIKGGKAVTEGAGLLSELAGKTAVKGAATGYGAGVAQNLSQGKGLGESFKPNTNTILGTVTGGLAPGIIEGASKFAKGLSGIDPQISNQLAKYGVKSEGKDTELYNKYISAAKTHSGDLETTSPLTMAADQLDEAASKIQKKVEKAGAQVGKAKEAGAASPLKPIQGIGDTFWKDVQDKYGLNLFTQKNGKIIAKKTAGTMLQTSPSDVSRIENIANQLSKLNAMGEKATAKHASEVIKNLNELVDFTKADVYGHTNDPLEGLIKRTAGNINDVLRESNPALAKANDAFSALKSLQDEITGMAGKTLNKGELLMRRVFSGDKSGDVQDLFGKIQKASGIDLTKHAVMAKHAIESVGSSADKTLLEKMISGAADSHTGGVLNTAVNIGKGLAKKTFANPEKIGRKLVKGKGAGVSKGLITKGAIKTATSLGGLINN